MTRDQSSSVVPPLPNHCRCRVSKIARSTTAAIRKRTSLYSTRAEAR